MHMEYTTNKILAFEGQKSYFAKTLTEAPCLKKGEDGYKSCNDTNAPDFIADDPIKPQPLAKKGLNPPC